MTTESHKLALSLINENTEAFSYKARLELARRSPWITVSGWAFMLQRYANRAEEWYEQKFDERPGGVFSPVDVLLAAAEVAEYYAEHVKEVDAA